MRNLLKLIRWAWSRFDGGWVEAGDARDIADNQYIDLKNVLPVSPGELRTRPGFYAVGATTPGVGDTPVWMYHWEEQDKWAVVKRTSGSEQDAYHWEFVLMDEDGSNMTVLTTSDGATHELPHCVSFGYGDTNRLYVAFGDQICSYAPTTNASWHNPHHTNCPKASFLLVRDDQLWACGDTDYPGRIHRSDVLDTTNWTTANAGYFDIDAPGEASVMKMFAGAMWVFFTGKNPSIRIVQGTPTTSYQVLPPYKENAPSIFRYSVTDTPWGLAFASRGGLWLIYGSGPQAQMTDIGEAIRPYLMEYMTDHHLGEGVMAYSDLFDTLIVKTKLDGSGYSATSALLGRAVGRYFPWAKYTGPQIACPTGGDKLVVLNRSNSEQLLCFGQDWNLNATCGVVADYDTQWHDIACVVDPKETDLEQPAVMKNVRTAGCDLNVDGTVTKDASLDIYKDGGASAITSVSITARGGQRQRQNVNFDCDTVRVKVTWNQGTALTTTQATPLDWQEYEDASRLHLAYVEYQTVGDIKRKQEA